MKKHRFISPLTQEQYSHLEKIRLESRSKRAQDRAHAIILSSKGYTIEELTEFFEVDRDTISRWFKLFEKYDAVGLWDNLRPGRTPILNESEIDLALEILEKKPNQSKSALQAIIEKTGKNLSHRTLKRIAKRHGLIWKRIKKVPKKPYNESEFKQAQEDLKAFETQAKKGKCEVVYFDATGCDLTPCVSHAWQPIGNENTIPVPSSRSKRLNILGFLDSTGDELTSLVFEGGTISSAEVIASLDEFCREKMNEIKSEKSDSTESPKPMSKQRQNPFQKKTETQAKPFVKIHSQSPKKEATTSVELIESVSLETDKTTNLNRKYPSSKAQKNRSQKGQETQAKPFVKTPSQSPTSNVLKKVELSELETDTVTNSNQKNSPSKAQKNRSQKNLETQIKPFVKTPSQSPKNQVLKNVQLIENASLELDTITNPNQKSPLATFDNFVFEKPIILAIDNAPVHTSDAFTNAIERWQAMGLFLYFLPTYSPQLNKIEILWKKIKYEWLPLDAYQNFTKLKKAIDEILSQYGNNYRINFA